MIYLKICTNLIEIKIPISQYVYMIVIALKETDVYFCKSFMADDGLLHVVNI